MNDQTNDAARLEVWPDVLASKEALAKLREAKLRQSSPRTRRRTGTHGNRDRCLGVEALELINLSGKKRLLDKEGLMRLEKTGELREADSCFSL